MTVAEMRDRMEAGEYQDWLDFYAMYPFDDLHRIHRPAALVSVSMAGGGDAFADRLEVLQPDPKLAGLSDVDKSLIRAFEGRTGKGGG